MNAVIVNCFDTYEDRVDLIYDYFASREYNVSVIQSDFRHLKKEKRKDKKSHFIFIESTPYYKNMSIARLKSHYNFSKKAFKLVEHLKPDLLYVLVPPNSLVKFASEYKQKYKEVKLIFDIIDLWPETIPIGKIKKFPPFIFWQEMRNKNLKQADYVITECNLYQEVLKKALRGLRAETVYLAKRDEKVVSNPNLDGAEFHLCYLGSINNIIDIRKIKKIIKLINEIKPTTLHLIGDGESRDLLVNEIHSVGARVEYYGKIYDQYKKTQIFNKCQFGLNIMKESVCVGLTMKSIDYFQAGLPILNNIQADTNHLVNEYKIGININDKNIVDTINEIANLDSIKLIEMRKNARKVFEEKFSTKAFNDKFNDIIKELYNEGNQN